MLQAADINQMRLSTIHLSEHFKTAKPIIIRLAVFLLFFVIAASIIGPHIISRDLFYRYGFQFYGEAGKGLISAVIAFLLLIWRKRPFPKLQPWGISNIGWALGSLGALLLEWKIIDRVGRSNPGILWPVAAHICIAAIIVLLLCFSFGVINIRLLMHSFKNELTIAAVLWVVFTAFLYLIYGLWRFLASTVLDSVRALFNIIGISSIYIPPQSILFKKFEINIAQGCSGIESIALFTGLYVLIGILDWQRFNHKKYLVVFVPALVLLFGFNILRVFTLILAGYYINPQIAFSLFHTYAGMVFFVIYSLIFWGISYHWILQAGNTKHSHKAA